jgi:hypothetical protein
LMIKAPHYLILMGKYRDIKHDGTNPKTILGQAKLKRSELCRRLPILIRFPKLSRSWQHLLYI